MATAKLLGNDVSSECQEQNEQAHLSQFELAPRETPFARIERGKTSDTMTQALENRD
jgi:hypothetical protein